MVETHGVDFGVFVVVLAERITDPVVAQIETTHVGVVDKFDAEEVEHFALFEQGVFPQVADAVYHRVFAVGGSDLRRYFRVVDGRGKVVDTSKGVAEVFANEGCKPMVSGVVDSCSHSMPIRVGHNGCEHFVVLKSHLRAHT